jgi:Choice-of-anchor I domain
MKNYALIESARDGPRPTANHPGATIRIDVRIRTQRRFETICGRLKVTSSPPTGKHTKKGETQYRDLYSFGARSFSIWSDQGALVYDSGDQFDRVQEAFHNAGWILFNANDDADAFDNRSDDKGCEPEGAAVGEAFGRTYAFITLERIGGVMVYDVSDPGHPFFADYVNNRAFGDDPDAALGPDLSPEGIIFVAPHESPNNKPLVVVANSVSGTTTIFELRRR